MAAPVMIPYLIGVCCIRLFFMAKDKPKRKWSKVLLYHKSLVLSSCRCRIGLNTSKPFQNQLFKKKSKLQDALHFADIKLPSPPGKFSCSSFFEKWLLLDFAIFNIKHNLPGNKKGAVCCHTTPLNSLRGTPEIRPKGRHSCPGYHVCTFLRPKQADHSS